MAGPISPRTLTLLLACGGVLPFAAFFAAYPFEAARRKALNILSFAVGVAAIAVVSITLYLSR